MTLQHAERLSLVERVIDQLRTQITAGSWECGERIPTEPQLSDILGVGRNTVREAVRALVHTGLLEVRLRIPRHSDTQPTLIRTPVPRSFGQAVEAQRRRGGIVSPRCPASSISSPVCASTHP